MPQVNPKCYHISASSIAAFKACPQRFRLAYREGLRRAEDTDSQRQGTNWHRLHEVYAAAYAATLQDPEHCELAHESGLGAVVEELNRRYNNVPVTKTAVEWAVEKEILLQSFIGYLWYWQNDPVEVMASEVKFDLPVYVPGINRPLLLAEVKRVGKIDEVAKWQGAIVAVERKSTSRTIDPSSDYWDKAKKDTQVSMYAAAFRDMQESGTLPDSIKAYLYGNDEQRTEGQILHAESPVCSGSKQGLPKESATSGAPVDILCDKERVYAMPGKTKAVLTVPSPRSDGEAISDREFKGQSESGDDLGRNPEMRDSVRQLPLVPARRGESASAVRFGNCLYDVWKKPTIKPAMLTQKDTAEFLENGQYQGTSFKTRVWRDIPADGHDLSYIQRVEIDGQITEVEPGKKGFAIRETPAMYGARLLADIMARPDFYYQRKEIVRTEKELAEFQNQVYNVYQAMKHAEKTGGWWENESQCRATFTCPNVSICYGPGADAVCDGKTTPDKFKRIFVDLTINNQEISDE